MLHLLKSKSTIFKKTYFSEFEYKDWRISGRSKTYLFTSHYQRKEQKSWFSRCLLGSVSFTPNYCALPLRVVLPQHKKERTTSLPLPRGWWELLETKYSRMDQMKFVEDSLQKIVNTFLKTVFHKFHFVHSCILCPISCISVPTFGND